MIAVPRARILARPAARRQTDGVLTLSSPLTWLIAGYFFYLPLANVPPMKIIRNGILQIPQPTGSFETGVHPFILLLPDFAFAVALAAVALPFAASHPRRHWISTLLVGLMALLVLGGGLASSVSESPGISLAGLLGRVSVLTVAYVIASRTISEAAIRIWIYAVLFGLALILANGFVVYLEIFGWPDGWADLPARRNAPGWQQFGLVTWGHAANTSGVLLLTLPVTSMMLWTRRRGSVLERAFLGFMILAMGLMLLIAFQRWALVCVVVCASMVLVRGRGSGRSVWLLAFYALIYVLVVRALLASLGSYFAAAVGENESSLGSRVDVWKEGLGYVREQPFGIGFELTYRLGFGGQGSSHSLVLDETIEGGILVGLLICVWTAVVAWSTLRGAVLTRTTTDLQFGLFLSAAAYSLFGVFFNGQLYSGGLAIWLALWILLPTAAYAMEQPAPQLASPESNTRNENSHPRSIISAGQEPPHFVRKRRTQQRPNS